MIDILSQLIEAFGAQSVLTGAQLAGRGSSYLEDTPLKPGRCCCPPARRK